MKIVLAVGFIAWASVAQAQSICCGSSVTTLTMGNGLTDSGTERCDSNDKTPTEAIDCKLAYWRKEVERLTKYRDELTDKINKAQDRVQAFTDAKRKQTSDQYH